MLEVCSLANVFQKRFEHEVTVWANLRNDHILPFYGIVTDQGQHIHMVLTFLFPAPVPISHVRE